MGCMDIGTGDSGDIGDCIAMTVGAVRYIDGICIDMSDMTMGPNGPITTV